MTPDDAAAWMVAELNKRKYLDHAIAAYELLKLDKSLVHYNDAGNLALDKKVLVAFRNAMPDDVVWSRGEQHWRYRNKSDASGRMQS